MIAIAYRKMNLLILFMLFVFINYAEPYKVLILYPLALKSLTSLGYSAVRHLLNAGHEVTFISSYPLKYTHKNLRQVDIGYDVENRWNQHEFDIGYILENELVDNDILGLQEVAKETARQTFQNENMTKFLENPNERFDAVIVDLFETEIYAGLSVLYDCPMIWLYSMGAHWKVLRLIAEPTNPAYDVDAILPHILPLDFKERVNSLWSRIQWHFYKTFMTAPAEQEIYEQTFGPLLSKRGKPLPNYQEVVFNASFIFGNEHNAVSLRPSTPQNFKYIGGFFIEDPVVPLPKDLQEILDKSSNGFIYFSMGSFFKSKGLPKSLINALLEVFGELKHTVIWKFEADLPGLPKNVHILKWAPQQSILAHPNCKFFITHGGLLSTIESIHFGVPTIGIPVFLDQYVNINRGVEAGYAMKVGLNYDLPKNLKASIEIILKDERYRIKVKELSKIYHNVPIKPGAEFVHWVEHTIWTGGAPHLRSPAHQPNFYQRYYLDLAAVFVGVITIVIMIIKSVCKVIIPKNKNRKSKKN